MATAKFDNEVWLITGNAHNWGRAPTFKAALANAIKSAGMSHPMTEAHVFRISANRELKGEDLWVDDFGTIHYAKDVQYDKCANWKVPKKLTDAYFAFDLEAEEVEYSDPIDKVFG